jgi:hypothetical protein
VQILTLGREKWQVPEIKKAEIHGQIIVWMEETNAHIILVDKCLGNQPQIWTGEKMRD